MIYYDQVIPGGTLLGYLNADHWAIGVPIARSRPTAAALLVDKNAFPREILLEALLRYIEEDLGPLDVSPDFHPAMGRVRSPFAI
jgi:hypothetical protein